MDDVGFCHHCGKVMDRQFRFCPWCGSQQRGTKDWKDLLDECLAPLEAQEKSHLLDRLHRLDGVLLSLEGELQEFMEQMPTPGR